MFLWSVFMLFYVFMCMELLLSFLAKSLRDSYVVTVFWVCENISCKVKFDGKIGYSVHQNNQLLGVSSSLLEFSQVLSVVKPVLSLYLFNR